MPAGLPRILLTGACGSLGRAVREAGAEQAEFVGVDVKAGGDPSVREGSFGERKLLDELLPGCAAVIHTAAAHGRFLKTHTPAQFTEINVTGLIELLEACVRHGVKKVVFSSTMEAVIGRDWAAAGLAVVDETFPVLPDWIYPLNKIQGEQAGAYYHARFGIQFVALRYMAFGSYSKPGPDLLARVLMPLDVAQANLAAAMKDDLGFQVLHIGPETPLTCQDIEAAVGGDPYAVVEKHWPGSAEFLRARGIELPAQCFWPVTRIDKARRVLGWRPEVTFESWLREQGWNGNRTA
ncbi:MAG: NAD(P)-dependent oxidoreductase [Planctomycetota bacterium]|nr:NAD(P)-dependent oxidoreductase [Planctomycetota bacterium]